MQQLRGYFDGLLARTGLGGYEKARHYVQLQNKYLTFQHHFNSRNQEPEAEKEISANSHTSNLSTSIHDQEPVISQPTTVQAQAAVSATLVRAPAATLLKASPPLPPPGILTPPPTVKMPPTSK